jgi:SAM-dependent methyltransferase
LTDRNDDVWQGKNKIPWDDPDFSRRMLREHFAQTHDLASRRFAWIDRQTRWIHDTVMRRTAGSILDLGCGPGLYCHRLAAMGHRCRGIDFGPASVESARRRREAGDRCEFALADIRTAEYGGPYDLVMLLYGELNVFSPEDARGILELARASLARGGRVIVEVQTDPAVRTIGAAASTEELLDAGLFSDRRHRLRTRCEWVPAARAAVQMFTVTDLASGQVTEYRHVTRAWTDGEVAGLLVEAGLVSPARCETWPCNTDALRLWIAEPSWYR